MKIKYVDHAKLTNSEFDQKYKIREYVTVKISPFVQWQLCLNKIVQN